MTVEVTSDAATPAPAQVQTPRMPPIPSPLPDKEPTPIMLPEEAPNPSLPPDAELTPTNDAGTPQAAPISDRASQKSSLTGSCTTSWTSNLTKGIRQLKTSWHQRVGHPSPTALQRTHKFVEGVPKSPDADLPLPIL